MSVQGFTQKYTIIQLLETIPEGVQFPSADWPLHVTNVDTFAIGWDVPTMIRELEGLLANHPQAASVAESNTFFGSDTQTQVTLLQKTDSLTRLHNDVLALLKNGGLRLNDPQFAGEGFVPHSTVQKQAKLHKGDQVVFNALTIIDMFPDKDPYQRKVLKTIRIGQ
jgi:2'-5' RNA ligase